MTIHGRHLGVLAGCVAAAMVSVRVTAVALMPPAAQQTPVPPRFSSHVQGVLVDVEVKIGSTPVPGLRASDFEVRDNGVVQDIEVINSTDAPINTVLALDTSASTVGQRLVDLGAGSRALLNDLKPGDRAALTTFNQRVVPRVGLTADLDTVRIALNRITPSGETALLDGVYAALLATQTIVGRALVVVYTDGGDTASWLQPDEVLEAAKRSNAVLDAVVMRTTHRWASLKTLVDATGGQAVVVDSSSALAAEFARILREFRSRYVLTFIPRGVEPGGFHKLDVRVKRGGAKVTARPGYFSDRKAP